MTDVGSEVDCENPVQFQQSRRRIPLRWEDADRSDTPIVLDKVAFRILTSAKKMAPVRTGALRASGRVRKVNQFRRIVQFGGAGTGVDYAQAVEFGTFRQSPKPFLRPAVLRHKKDIENIMLKAVNHRLTMIAKQAQSR